jgi:hypothetical protein
MKRINLISGAAAALLSIGSMQAQNHVNGSVGNTVLTTTVPFLLITPDSRSGAMGDVGVAISPDANTMHWNPSKLAFMDHDYGFALNYTPWLKALVPDISLSYLSAYKKIDKLSGIGASLRYFSLGDITFTDDFGNYLNNFRPYEFAADLGYARKLSENFSIGIAGRFIYSNLAGHTPTGSGSSTRAGYTFAGDISGFYTKPIKVRDYKGVLNFGGNISNIGGKITYTNASDRDFIPINLRLGAYTRFAIDDHNEIGFGIDLNKLLVPSNAIYKVDSAGNPIPGPDGKPIVIDGQSPDVPVITGMIHSFYDAPGGFSEEMSEINPSIGIEYWYEKMVAARIGYFYESPSKGDRQYLTTGLGIKFKVMTLDFSYLIPTSSPKSLAKSPLANTLRFSLLFNFDGGKSK